MDSTSLRIFLAVARRLNYTRAAEDVHLSQPAVSRRIHQLEHELGVKLFEQIGKSVGLTDAGLVLAREGERTLGDLERLGEAVRTFRSADQGTVRLGASATPGFYLVPPVLGRFHRQFPRVDLSYRIENSERVVQKLIRNEIDLGFVGDAGKTTELHEELRFQDEIVCVVAAEHPLAGRRSVRPADLASQTLVSREHGSATRALVERWLAKHRVRPVRTIELGCPEAVKSVVASGLGVAFMSRLGITRELSDRALAVLKLPALPLVRQLVLVRHIDKSASPAISAFLSHLRRALERRASA